MVFSSFTFLFLFLPSFVFLYYLAPSRLRNWIALVFSYLFYAWGAPKVVPILLGSSIIDWYVSRHRRFHANRWLFFFGVALNLLILVYFKYVNFFIDQASQFVEGLGGNPISWTAIALPAGVSFFTFQKISYLADVYSRRTEPASKLHDYLLYVAFFPQLIAGPILRYHDVCQQILRREHSTENFFWGFSRFAVGLAKKVLIADSAGKIADQIFSLVQHGDALPGGIAWIGIIAYSVQIYFDFSGYSDMAIGLARMIGFRFLENFNMPYISQSITEFWRRWHISLSNWMKEYLYVPLGGNRGGAVSTYRNLVIVFLLSGFWHGANWTFILWGAYHGLLLIAERLFLLRITARLPKLFTVAITFVLVCLGWVLFRAQSVTDALHYYQYMFAFQDFFAPHPTRYMGSILDRKETFYFLIGVFFCFVPAFSVLVRAGEALWGLLPRLVRVPVSALAMACVFALAIVTLSNSHFSPFLYFEF